MAQHDDFRGNVVLPRSRASLGHLLGGVLIGLVVISSLIGTLLLARPALDVEQPPVPEAPNAADGSTAR
ncbi:hypothetical protein [Streptomyces radicis]|uniref:Uncharacterized protein n=1 Tax=Streptomyces radicis TaxID=1750517 RepID=A0A3A9W1U5_9ACTN|nr:hypothetical protein [Streptomyces radicis]RKN06732.1 hypothetical protein D7319_21720 [Streptomyces radicis]RKN19358.1 hypothetical protein D7318_21185 [Streptomyces radicis]